MGIKSDMKKRENELNRVLRTCENNLKKAPEGRIKISRRGGQINCAIREGEVGTPFKYVKKKDLKQAQKIAQRDYDQSIMKSVEKELKAISAYEKKLPEKTFEEIFEKMNPARKLFITPHFVPDDEYIEKWQNEPYEPKAFLPEDPEHYTNRGERVRSKSEVIIANLLNDLNIPYKYECPIRVNGIIMHPDFTILKMPERRVLYWEHFGRMGDNEYVQSNMKRMLDYEAGGIFPGDNLIFTMESKDLQLNQNQVKKIIKHYIFRAV